MTGGPLDGRVLSPGQRWAVAYDGDPDGALLVELVAQTSSTTWHGLAEDGSLVPLDVRDPGLTWVEMPDEVVEVVDVDLDAVAGRVLLARSNLRALTTVLAARGRLGGALRDVAAEAEHHLNAALDELGGSS